MPGVFLYPHFVKIPPWAKRSSSRGRTTLRCGTGKIRPRLTEETKQYQQQQFPRKNSTSNSNSSFIFLFLSVSILSLILSSLLLAYGSVRIRFSSPARRRFRSFIFRKKERYFFICFLQVFRCFSIVFSTLPVRIFLFENVLFPYRKTAFQMSFPNGLYSDLYRKTILGYITPSAQVNWAKSIKLRKNSELRRKKSGTK